MTDLDLDELRAELADFAQPHKEKRSYTAREERIIAGFEDILRFADEHDRPPEHGEDRDIFERLYAVRLDRLRELEECRELLAPMDSTGLLTVSDNERSSPVEDLDPDAILAELGGDAKADGDIRELKHVQSREERRAAEEIATQNRCADFDRFEPLFEQVQADLDRGVRQTRPFGKDASVAPGDFFILRGQMAYVAEIGDPIKAPNGQYDARLRVVYSNGTESNLLRWSLQRALYKDEAGRRITDGEAGPLFGEDGEDDTNDHSGTVYVLRSKSDHPYVAEHRELVHKIGVTGGSVEARIAGAEKQSTYLLAGVELIASYDLYGYDRKRIEALVHKVFSAAQLNLEIPDRFGNTVRPREWFLVPLQAIDDAMSRFEDRTIGDYRYDPSEARLVRDAKN